VPVKNPQACHFTAPVGKWQVIVDPFESDTWPQVWKEKKAWYLMKKYYYDVIRNQP
jgi:hypothetical protein